MADNRSESTWMAEVLKADKDFPKKSKEAPAYTFSNDREFVTTERPGEAYPWAAP